MVKGAPLRDLMITTGGAETLSTRTRRLTLLEYLGSLGLFMASMACAAGFVGNSWAASFRDAHYALYVQHLFICAAGALILFVCSVVLLIIARRSRKQGPDHVHGVGAP